MKPQDIKVGYIYYVNFNPVKKGEFADKHLAVVLNKNVNNITFVTIPFTSQKKGVGVNKVELGKLICLPENLSDTVSYAVLDQVRTVTAERFSRLLENGKPIEAELPKELLTKLRTEYIKEILYSASKEEQNAILIDILHSNMHNVD